MSCSCLSFCACLLRLCLCVFVMFDHNFDAQVCHVIMPLVCAYVTWSWCLYVHAYVTWSCLGCVHMSRGHGLYVLMTCFGLQGLGNGKKQKVKRKQSGVSFDTSKTYVADEEEDQVRTLCMCVCVFVCVCGWWEGGSSKNSVYVCVCLCVYVADEKEDQVRTLCMCVCVLWWGFCVSVCVGFPHSRNGPPNYDMTFNHQETCTW